MKKTNGDGNLYVQKRNGRKYYTKRITVGFDEKGNQIRKSFSGYNITEVNKKAREAQALADKGTFTITPKVTFQDIFKDWLFTFKQNEVSKASFNKYETSYRLRLYGSILGKSKLCDINVHLIQKHINLLAKNHSSKILKEYLVLLKSCLQFAVDENYIYSNPAKNVKISKKDTSKDKVEAFSEEDQGKILTYLKNKLKLSESEIFITERKYNEIIVDAMIYIDFGTGLRLGEILALTWDDLKDDILNVDKAYKKTPTIYEDGTKTWEKVIDTTKTEAGQRKLPLSEKTLQILNSVLKIQSTQKLRIGDKYNSNNNLIFGNYYGDFIGLKKPNRQLGDICSKLEIDRKTFHSIRHTYITRLVELGVKIKSVQVLAGHSDISTTLATYTHVSDKVKKESAQLLDRVL